MKYNLHRKNGSGKVASNRNVLKLNNIRSKTSSSSSSSSSLAPLGEPWNHEEFLKRVETFSPLRWHIRRRDVSPLLCARYGWKCVHGQINTLKCIGCGTIIKYKTNLSWSNDISLGNNLKRNDYLSLHIFSCFVLLYFIQTIKWHKLS